jgi:thymidylate synthase
MLTHIIARKTGLKPKEFVHVIGNAHIYEDHIEPLKTQIERQESVAKDNSVVKFIIKETRECLDDYKIDDFDIEGYNPMKAIKMNMSA